MNAVNAGIACVAGGMLLYSSLVNIMAEDVKRPVSLTPSSPPSPFPLAIPLLIAQDMAKGMLRREGRHAHALVSFDRSVCVWRARRWCWPAEGSGPACAQPFSWALRPCPPLRQGNWPLAATMVTRIGSFSGEILPYAWQTQSAMVLTGASNHPRGGEGGVMDPTPRRRRGGGGGGRFIQSKEEEEEVKANVCS